VVRGIGRASELNRGPHPAVVWLHGSGEQPRLTYGPLVTAYINDGIAFFTYDKRGIGESEGECCPDVDGHFNLVTADAVAAVNAARSYSGIDPGVLQHSIVAKFEEYTGGSESTEPRPSEAEIAKKVASFDRSGFDPKPCLEKLDVPALWLFGGADCNVPPVQSVAELRSIKQEQGKDWTIVVYPSAGHGLFDSPATDARAAPRAEEWVREHVNL
jgi:uncharacterized protein